MICEKCGYCCAKYDVIVVIDPDAGFVEGNLTHKPAGAMCHHCAPDGTCSVHDKEWYVETACHSYDYGDGKRCRISPGPEMAAMVREKIRVHDPRSVNEYGLDQSMLLEINSELRAHTRRVMPGRDAEC